MTSSHRNSGPGHHTRAIVKQVDDSGPQQLVEMTGLTGQTFGETVRSQHFGLTSNPPPGSEGVGLHLGGGADRVHALGMEHPQYRPKNLPVGATRLYDKAGNYVDIRDGVLTAVHAKQITAKVGDNTSVTLTTDTITLTAANIKINGKIDLNG